MRDNQENQRSHIHPFNADDTFRRPFLCEGIPCILQRNDLFCNGRMPTLHCFSPLQGQSRLQLVLYGLRPTVVLSGPRDVPNPCNRLLEILDLANEALKNVPFPPIRADCNGKTAVWSGACNRSDGSANVGGSSGQPTDAAPGADRRRPVRYSGKLDWLYKDLDPLMLNSCTEISLPFGADKMSFVRTSCKLEWLD